jgi:hypothetical protein
MRRALTVLGVDGKVVEFWGSSTDQCASDELIGRPGGNVTGWSRSASQVRTVPPDAARRS